MIHTFILSEACENQAVYTGECPPVLPNSIIEDTQTCFKTLKSIKSCVYDLEQVHKQYVWNTYRQTKYGSE